MKKTLANFMILVLFTGFAFCAPKSKLYERNIEGKKDCTKTPSTRSTRGENLTREQYESYVKLVEEGCTDEEVVYQLGLYHLILQDSWYSDEAEYYLKIGAAQNSPRCLFLLINRCSLRGEDLTDVESYDVLRRLAENDYEDALEWFNKINPREIERIELKRQGIIIDD